MEEFKKAKVGLHAMWNEHFGIGLKNKNFILYIL
jgi:hypothetical protein